MKSTDTFFYCSKLFNVIKATRPQGVTGGKEREKTTKEPNAKRHKIMIDTAFSKIVVEKKSGSRNIVLQLRSPEEEISTEFTVIINNLNS